MIPSVKSAAGIIIILNSTGRSNCRLDHCMSITVTVSQLLLVNNSSNSISRSLKWFCLIDFSQSRFSPSPIKKICNSIKSESEPPPETLVFKKWREQFHVVYVSDKLWTSDKMLLEEKEKSGFLQPVLTTLGIESLKNVASSSCYVLQRDSE